MEGGIEAKKEEKRRLKEQINHWKAKFKQAHDGRKATPADYDEEMQGWVEDYRRISGELQPPKSTRTASEPKGSPAWPASKQQSRPSNEAATEINLHDASRQQTAYLAAGGGGGGDVEGINDQLRGHPKSTRTASEPKGSPAWPASKQQSRPSNEAATEINLHDASRQQTAYSAAGGEGGGDVEGGASASQEPPSSPARGQSWTPLRLDHVGSDTYSQSGSNSHRFRESMRQSTRGILRTNSMLVADFEWKQRGKSPKYQSTSKNSPRKAYRGDDPAEVVKRLDIQFGRMSDNTVELLEEAIFENDLPLPETLNFRPSHDEKKKKLAFVYTDLEPDDVFAILCHVKKMLPDLAEPPLIVWTTQETENGKDAEGIYMKKKLLATTALGLDLVKTLIEVAVVENMNSEKLPGSARQAVEEGGGMQKTAERLLEWAEKYSSTEIELEILIMAPGRSNLGTLNSELHKKREMWISLAKKSVVRLYSGQFNIKGMEEEDMQFIKETATLNQEEKPLVDIAHYVYTGGEKAHLMVKNLSALCPQLGKRIDEVNPFLGAAWKIYAAAFNKKMLDPTGEGRKAFDKKLKARDEIDTKQVKSWAEAQRSGPSGDAADLESFEKITRNFETLYGKEAWKKKEEELKKISIDEVKEKLEIDLDKIREELKRQEKELDQITKRYSKNPESNFWDYIQDLHESTFKYELGNVRSRIVNSLATIGYHESPLCDCLVYLHCWLEEEHPNSIENVKGEWWYDIKKGRTGVKESTDKKVKPAGVIAVSPRLSNPNDETVIKKMAEHLEKVITEAVHLHMSREPVISDIFTKNICSDDEWTKAFFQNHKKLWKSLCNKHEGDGQIEALAAALEIPVQKEGRCWFNCSSLGCQGCGSKVVPALSAQYGPQNGKFSEIKKKQLKSLYRRDRAGGYCSLVELLTKRDESYYLFPNWSPSCFGTAPCHGQNHDIQRKADNQTLQLIDDQDIRILQIIEKLDHNPKDAFQKMLGKMHQFDNKVIREQAKGFRKSTFGKKQNFPNVDDTTYEFWRYPKKDEDEDLKETGKIQNVFFTPDGKRILMVYERCVMLRSQETPRVIRRERDELDETEDTVLGNLEIKLDRDDGLKRKVQCACFSSHKGKRGSVNIETHNLVAAFAPEKGQYSAKGCLVIKTYIFNENDGEKLLSGKDEERATTIEYKESNMDINVMAFSPDGKYLAIGITYEEGESKHPVGRVEIFDIDDLAKQRKPLKRKLSGVSRSSSNPRRSLSLSFKDSSSKNPVSFSETFMTWFAEGKQASKIIPVEAKYLYPVLDESEDGAVKALAWSPRGDRLVVGMGSKANMLRIQSKDKQELESVYQKPIERDGQVSHVAFSGDGTSVCIAYDAKAAVYDASSKSYLFEISASAEIKSMRFSKDGSMIGIGCRNKLKALQLWPGKPDFGEEHLLKDGDELFTKKLDKGVRCLDFSPCGTKVVVGFKGDVVRVLSPGAGRVCYQKKNEGRIWSGSISENGRRLAYVSADDAEKSDGKKSVEVIDLSSGTSERQIPANKFSKVSAVTITTYNHKNEGAKSTAVDDDDDDDDDDDNDGDYSTRRKLNYDPAEETVQEEAGEKRAKKDEKEMLVFCGELQKKERKGEIEYEGLVVIQATTSNWEELFLLKFPEPCRSLCSNGSCLCIAMQKHVEILQFEHLWKEKKREHGKNGPTTIYMPVARSQKKKVAVPEDEPKVWPFRDAEDGKGEDIMDMTIGYSKNSLGDLIMSIDMHSDEHLHDEDERDHLVNYNRNLIVFGGLDNFARVIPIPTEYDEDKECYQGDSFKIERPNRVRATKFNHDGSRLAIGGVDCRIGLYETHHGHLLTTIDACSAVIHTLAFSQKSSYLAVGDDKSAIVYRFVDKSQTDNELDEGQYKMVYRLQNDVGNRVTYIGFALPRHEDEENAKDDERLVDDDESHLVFGSFDKFVTMLSQTNENGPPVALIDDSQISCNRAIEFNKLLPIITNNPYSLLDRAVNSTFSATGKKKAESYLTLKTLLSSPMGPMAIQLRHFMMSIAERDEELLELLLRASCQHNSPLRLRFEATQIICFAINSSMGSAVSAVFKDLELEETGCEMHVNVEKLTNDQKSTKLKAMPHFDHWYAWEDMMEHRQKDGKQISHQADLSLAKSLRVSLPALTSRMLMSRLLDVKKQQGQIELWGSKVMSTVIESVYEEKFKPVHNAWTALFVLEFFLFVCYTALLNGDVYQFVDVHRTLLKKWLEVLLTAISVAILFHEIHQHFSISERVNKWRDHFKTVNLCDACSQIFLLLIVTYGYLTGNVLLRADDEDDGEYDDEINNNAIVSMDFLDETWLAIALAAASFLLMIKCLSLVRGYRTTAWQYVALIEMTQSTIPFFIIVIIFCFFFGIIFFVLTKQAEMEWDDDRFEDDTIDSFKHNIRSSLYRTMLAGLGGDFSSAGFKYQEAGFKQAANVEVMQTFFLILIFVVQIIALNGLIAILSNTFEKVNYEKTARVNKELAQMMVEYMDTWSFFPESWSNRFEPCSKRVGGVLSKIWNCIFRCTAKDMGAKCQCCEKNKSCCCCHSMGKWLYKAFKYMENHDHIFDDLETMELKTCWVHKLELCSQKMSRKFTEDLKASSRRANNKRHDETQRKVSHIEDLMTVMQVDIEKLHKAMERLIIRDP